LAHQGFLRVHLLLRDDVLAEALVALEVEPSILKQGLVLYDLALDLTELNLEGAGIDFGCPESRSVVCRRP
jgi:hypothetical protein